jgi:hypothetical protein
MKEAFGGLEDANLLVEEKQRKFVWARVLLAITRLLDRNNGVAMSAKRS